MTDELKKNIKGSGRDSLSRHLGVCLEGVTETTKKP
jgi:hypothetical protein